jgi:hypothetical protein
MKNLFVFITLFFCLLVNTYSQDWLPVSTSIKSVFTTDHYPTPLACFSIDSIHQVSSDSIIYYNYQLYGEKLNDSSIYDVCLLGLGPACRIIQNKMSWLGREIINVNNYWNFITNNNDSLKFNFNSIDTSIVFQNNDRILKIHYLNDTVNNIFGTLDSIKEFELLQYDASNNIIQDELFNKTIRLSKHYGLLDFIEVRDYPDSIQFYSIIGSANATDTVGKINIKEYELHQSEVGTITQFENKRDTYYTCCPTEHPGYYSLETYETIGSTFSGSNYVLTHSSYNAIIDSMVIDTNIIAYSIPFIRNSDNQRINIKIDSTECYGFGYYILTSYNDCEGFCPTYNCYSSTGSEILSNNYCTEYYIYNNPNAHEIYIEYPLNAPTFPPRHERDLKYTLVNGNSCGTRGYTNINDQTKEKQVIFPNPAIDYLFIKGVTSEIKAIIIRDLNGRIVKNLTSQVQSIDISSLSKGSYFIEVETQDEVIKNSFIKK